MIGLLQKATMNQRYNGWRARRYGPGVLNASGSCCWPLKNAQLCLSPKRSKWSIKKVVTRTVPQPAQNKTSNTAFPRAFSTDQTGAKSGCQYRITSSKATLASSTDELRSAAFGTTFVQ